MNTQTIPILDLKAQYQSIKDEIHVAIERVLDTQQFILGSEVENFEEKVANYCDCKFGIGVSSGTDALLLSLMAVGINPGDEVITTPYSFFATAGSIARLGAIPVFVDIDPLTFNIQPQMIEAAISSKTRAIIPVHLAGQVADMDPIMVSAKAHGLYVIEDACQAIGAEYKGKRAGSIGDIGCFSFFPSKNLGGYGDSGLVTTNDPLLADKIKLLRNHGQRPKYHNHEIGGNFRMDALQAAILNVKFNYLEEWTEKRRSNARSYHQLFTEGNLTSGNIIAPVDINLPVESGFGRHIYHLFMIRCNKRNELMAHLTKNQIGCEIYYPIPLHLQNCFNYLHYRTGELPQSELAANESLAIPIYPELTNSMQKRVVEVISDFFK